MQRIGKLATSFRVLGSFATAEETSAETPDLAPSEPAWKRRDLWLSILVIACVATCHETRLFRGLRDIFAVRWMQSRHLDYTVAATSDDAEDDG